MSDRQQVTADAAAIAAFVRRKLTAGALSTVVGATLATTILVIEYRLALFAIIALAIPLIVLLVAWRQRKELGAGARELVVHHGGLVLHNTSGDHPIAFGAIRLVRVAPDHLIVVYTEGQANRLWTLPAPPAQLEAIATRLRAAGVKVNREPDLARGLVAIFGGVLLGRILRVVAAVTIIGGLGNLIYGLATGSPSWGENLLYIGAGFLAAILAALIHVLLLDAPA